MQYLAEEQERNAGANKEGPRFWASRIGERCCCCAGGTALFTGLRDRLERELAEAAPHTAKVKVTSPANSLERRFSVWIGARPVHRITSLGAFRPDGRACKNCSRIRPRSPRAQCKWTCVCPVLLGARNPEANLHVINLWQS